MRRANTRMYQESLTDLDRELALLRRKKELLEEQQQLLNRQSDHSMSISPWDEPPRNFNSNPLDMRTLSNYNYIDMYDGGQNDQLPYHGNNRKRYSDGPQRWDQSAPKRFRNDQYRGNKSSGRYFDNHPRRMNPQVSGPKARSGPASKAQPQTPNRSHSAGNKVTKPKYTHKPLNKVLSYPQAERKQLVTETVTAVNKTNLPSEIIKEDVEPSNLAKGRMELALGEILKQIKRSHKYLPEHIPPFTLKAVKQMIRDRIRNAMIGKPVDNRVAIIEHYRNMYADDLPIVEMIKNDKKSNDKGLATITYIKSNMKNIINAQIEDMFSKIKQIYTGTDIQAVIDELVKEVADIEREFVSQKTDDDRANDDLGEKKSAETDDIRTEEVSFIEDKTDKNINKSPENATDEDQQTTNPEIATEKSEENNESDVKESNECVVIEKNPEDKLKRILDRMISLSVKRQLPHMITRFKNLIATLLVRDERMNEARDKWLRQQGKGFIAFDANAPKEDKKLEVQRPRLVIPYFVKIIGRPKLPKKEQLSEFLQKFKPLSIKKHRSVFNLLFVGFGTKGDYDSILAADGVKFGQNSLSIMHSEQKGKRNVAQKDPNETNNATVNDEKPDTVVPELDNQTTELLNSLKDTNTSETIAIEKPNPENETKVDDENEKVDDANEKIDDENEKVDGENLVNHEDKLAAVSEEKIENSADATESSTVQNDDAKFEDETQNEKEPLRCTRASLRIANAQIEGVSMKRTN